MSCFHSFLKRKGKHEFVLKIIFKLQNKKTVIKNYGQWALSF